MGLSRRGRLEEAIREHRKAMDLREKLASDFPTIPDYRRKLALAHTDLGHSFFAPRRLQEAGHHYRQAVTEWEKLRAEFLGAPEDRREMVGVRY